jgi:hypothetical protein
MKLLVSGTRLELFRCPKCGCVHVDIADDEEKTFARFDITVEEASGFVAALHEVVDDLRRDLQ